MSRQAEASNTGGESLGRRLKRARGRRGLTQWQVAAELLVREREISRWETERNAPRGITLDRLESWIWKALAPQEGVAEPAAPYGGIELVIAVRVMQPATAPEGYIALVGATATLTTSIPGPASVVSMDCQIVGVYPWLIRQSREGRAPGAR